MKRVISLCLVAIMAVAFVACSMKSEPEKIVDNYYKALQKKDYVTAIKVALGDPIMEGDKELSKEDAEQLINALADKLESSLENTTITKYSIESCEFSDDKNSAEVKVKFTTETEGETKDNEDEIELKKDDKGVWRMDI